MVTSMPGIVAPTRLAAAIRGSARVTAICHENPDADTLQAEPDGRNPAAR